MLWSCSTLSEHNMQSCGVFHLKAKSKLLFFLCYFTQQISVFLCFSVVWSGWCSDDPSVKNCRFVSLCSWATVNQTFVRVYVLINTTYRCCVNLKHILYNLFLFIFADYHQTFTWILWYFAEIIIVLYKSAFYINIIKHFEPIRWIKSSHKSLKMTWATVPKAVFTTDSSIYCMFFSLPHHRDGLLQVTKWMFNKQAEALHLGP